MGYRRYRKGQNTTVGKGSIKFSEYRELRQMKKHDLIMMAEYDARANFLLETDPKPWYVPKETRQLLMHRARYICQMCKGRNQRNKEDLHIDHKHPVSKGGTCKLDNLQVLCSWCNSSKSNHQLDPKSYKVGYPIPINVLTEKQIARLVLEKVNDEKY